MLFVTGGAGFIGSNFVLDHLKNTDESVVILDALTYAGNLGNLEGVVNTNRCHFIKGNILDEALVTDIFRRYRPRAIVHFAAESHVDRSIAGPKIFVETNVLGTTTLLEAAKHFFEGLSPTERDAFRFINISTDEVYGSLAADDLPSVEATPFNPSSPYSASKAAADQLGRAYCRTYGLPVITLRCTNNYGPRQHCEKLTPTVITKALAGEPIPIYGNGLQIRDWIHVSDFCRAIELALLKGFAGDIYNVGAQNELTNIEYVRKICTILDELCPLSSGSYARLITRTADRPGHDTRYAINSTNTQRKLDWAPKKRFDENLRATVEWYVRMVNNTNL